MTNNRYTSDELFHFVGRAHPGEHQSNYEVLRKVLRARHVSHPPHRADAGQTQFSVNWDKGLNTEELIVPTVTCFCDIPFDHLELHMSKYGRFGLSLDRDFLIRYGARPVIYIPLHEEDWRSAHGGMQLLKRFEETFKGLSEQVNLASEKSSSSQPTSLESAASNIWHIFALHFLGYIKPFDSQLADNNPNNYYLEREWRKYGNLKFEPHQVKRILVAQGFASRLRQEYPEYDGKIVEV